MRNTPPILIIKQGSASPRDIALARKAGVTVLVVKDPSDVRYMEPPLMPTTRLQEVAMKLVRHIGKGHTAYDSTLKDRLLAMFMEDTQPKSAEEVKP